MVKYYIYFCGCYKLDNCGFLITALKFYVNVFLSRLSLLNEINFNYLYGNKLIPAISYIPIQTILNYQFYHQITY